MAQEDPFFDIMDTMGSTKSLDLHPFEKVILYQNGEEFNQIFL